jgi:hypothetical protein
MAIRTDPENTEYVCHKGVEKKIEDFDPKSAETIELQSSETKEKLQTDTAFKLENAINDKQVGKREEPRLA